MQGGEIGVKEGRGYGRGETTLNRHRERVQSMVLQLAEQPL